MDNTKKTIDQKITSIINSKINPKNSVECIKRDDLLEIFGINSINFMQIIVGIETEFDFEFDDEKLNLNKFDTFGALVEYVEQEI